MPTFESARDGWDELERLQSCRKAISDLLIPEGDLHVVNRDALSQLLNYLDEQEGRVMKALRPLLALAG